MEVDEEAEQPVTSSFEEIEVVKGITSNEVAGVYGEDPLQHQPGPGYVRSLEGYIVPLWDAVSSADRNKHLDEYLEKVPRDQRDTNEYRDAYNERWNEFMPGHPQFTEEDVANLRRWHQKQLRGEPRIPELRQASEPASSGEPRRNVASTTANIPASEPSQQPVDWRAGCGHKHTTKKGTNKYYFMETCLHCHQVLRKEAKEQVKTTSSTATTTKKSPSACEHHNNVSWKGSNGYQWKNTCKDCGFSTSGCYKDGPAGLHRTNVASDRSKPTSSSPGMALGDTNEAVEMFRTCMIVASVKAQEGGQGFGPGDLHRILDAVIAGTTLSTTTTQAPDPKGHPASQRPDHLGDHPKDYKVINFGEYKGRTFAEAFGDSGYVRWCEDNSNTTSCRGLKELTEYLDRRSKTDPLQLVTWPSRMRSWNKMFKMNIKALWMKHWMMRNLNRLKAKRATSQRRPIPRQTSLPSWIWAATRPAMERNGFVDSRFL